MTASNINTAWPLSLSYQKDYLRNHTNIVTVDKKSVSLYLHQDGYNDKDDDVLSFRSSWDIFAKFDLLEIIVNCLLMMMMMVMVMMIKMVMMIPNPQILLSLKRWCSTTRFVVLLAIFWWSPIFVGIYYSLSTRKYCQENCQDSLPTYIVDLLPTMNVFL